MSHIQLNNFANHLGVNRTAYHTLIIRGCSKRTCICTSCTPADSMEPGVADPDAADAIGACACSKFAP